MSIFKNEDRLNENIDENCNKKWHRICKISNIIFSVLYVLFAWFFTLLGIMFLTSGFSDGIFVAVCCCLGSLLFLLTPIFCIFGIVFSVLLRKKEQFLASFFVQFLPFGTLGVALVSFFFSMI